MSFILQILQKMEPAERSGQIERLLRNYRDHLPQGGWEPLEDWPTLREVGRDHDAGNKFFTDLESLVGSSPAIEAAKTKYVDDAGQMMMLTLVDEVNRRNFPAHEFFPLYGKINEVLKQSPCAQSRILLNDLTFTTELLGSGGTADIYKAYSSDGTPYALKLFNRPHQRPRIDRVDREFQRSLRRFMRNVRENFDLFDAAPFARPVAVPSERSLIPWYVLEYSPGTSMRSQLRGEVAPQDAGRAMHTYATMLSYLHRSNVCFVDNNWGAVMLEPDRVRIVDYDASTSCELLSEGGCKVADSRYASREHLHDELSLTRQGDLEGFALMIDHLITGNPYIDYEEKNGNAYWVALSAAKAAAKSNSRAYPHERIMLLPTQLRQVVAPVIQYPRDDSITADDFLSAIKADYGL